MRRTKEDAEITRQKILEVSYEIINRKGFEKMTRNDIAVEMGMTRGAVNWHFKTKDEIYLSVLLNILDQFEIKRKKYQNDRTLTAKERMLGLFLLPINQSEAFRFVNSIPHYLLKDDRYSDVEKRMHKNRLDFLEYLEVLLAELEESSESTFKNLKSNIAQALYLVYEGLHNRNPWNTTLVAFDEKELWKILSVIIY